MQYDKIDKIMFIDYNSLIIECYIGKKEPQSDRQKYSPFTVYKHKLLGDI